MRSERRVVRGAGYLDEMKRDLDLIRQILLQAEREPPPRGEIPDVEIEGRSAEEVTQHVRLLEDAGFVKAGYVMGPKASIYEITWQGYDYLDSIRDDSVWKRVKDKMAEVGGTVPLEVVKALGTRILKERLGLPAE